MHTLLSTVAHVLPSAPKSCTKIAIFFVKLANPRRLRDIVMAMRLALKTVWSLSDHTRPIEMDMDM
eukprot:911625-Pleurochrysis_carterae.AAC.3